MVPDEALSSARHDAEALARNDANLAGVVICDSQWRILWANQLAENLFGSDRTHLAGRCIVDCIAITGRDAPSSKQLRPGLCEVKRDDGSRASVFVAVSQHNDLNVAHVHDAADLAKQFQDIAYQESIWRHAIESAGHGVWDYNSDNVAQFHSDHWKRMRGLPVDQPVQDTFEQWVSRLHPDDVEHTVECVRQHNSGEVETFSFEYREKDTSGEYVWIHASGRVVDRKPDGTAARVLGTDINITRLKEEEVRRTEEIKSIHAKHVLELEQAQQRTEAARQVAHILARQDPLTQLPNRRVFTEEIARLSQWEEDAEPFAVMVVDLDRFKPINDLYGHSTGDFIIRTAADRLLKAVGQDGIPARLGGDEFGVILKGSTRDTAQQAEDCANAIIAALNEPIRIGGFAVEIGASVGIALHPHDGRDHKSLFRNADMALYAVKQSARGEFRFYSEEMGREAEAKAVLENEVRRAVASDEIAPFFQPIVDAKSGTLTALEILARWTSKKLGSVSPDQFIPIIDQFNLMPQFTLSVLRQAIEASAAWPDRVAISINLSAKEVCDLSTPIRLFKVLAEHSFPPSRLKVEVTEQALMHDLFAAKQVIGAFRSAGVRVMLDDFGAGYAGLGYLRELKFDSIKIDRSFVITLLRQVESWKIVDAIQTLARNLDLETVAEGVEDAETLTALCAIGCNQVQGYLFSPAISASEVPALLGRGAALKRKTA
jgi:diguanylate cyclase (GGDEF)-like protein/PAS domain S-box-containing protein